MADQLETTPLRQVNAAPYYLPNLIAAIAASVGVIIGSVLPWASLTWLKLNGNNFLWLGKTTLFLGVVAGIASFTLLNRARTGSGTRWLAALAWVAPIVGLICLLVAALGFAIVVSASEQFVGLQVESGLWVVAMASVVLCATASVAAAQVGTMTENSQAWTRMAIVIGALILVGAGLSLVVIITNQNGQHQPTTAPPPPTYVAPAPLPQPTYTAPAPPPVILTPPAETVPPFRTDCDITFADAQFARSAGGNDHTTCPFAEEVRRAYVNQPLRGQPVTVNAWSPVAHENFTMTCIGSHVVTCRGGHDALVYLY